MRDAFQQVFHRCFIEALRFHTTRSAPFLQLLRGVQVQRMHGVIVLVELFQYVSIVRFILTLHRLHHIEIDCPPRLIHSFSKFPEDLLIALRFVVACVHMHMQAQ